MAISDAELLDAYARRGSESAFTELVGRYIHLVHGSAVRQLKDPGSADDVTQAVFILLARKAAKIRGDHLAGWLLKATRLCVADARKIESRRRRHEQQAAAMKSSTSQNAESAYQDILQYLDEAVGCLPARDSTAVSLRFLQNKSTAEVAATMGISADAAQKIIVRSLPKLRRILTGRGLILSSSASLTEAMLMASHHAAPANLAISAGAPSAVGLSIAKRAMKIIFWTKAQAVGAVAATTIILGATTGFVITHHDNASAGTTAMAPRTAQIPSIWPFDSPFLELEQCRIVQKTHLIIRDSDPQVQNRARNPALLAAAKATLEIFEKEAWKISWSTDPAIAARTDHYRVSLASEEDATERNIDAPIVANDPPDLPQYSVDMPVPNPGQYYVHVRALDKAGRVVAQSGLPVQVMPLIKTDIEICDIGSDGIVHFYGVLQSLNDTGKAIREDSFSNSPNVQLYGLMDGKDRRLRMTTRTEQNAIRCFYTLNDPIPPDQWQFIAGYGQTIVPAARKVSNDEWEYSANFGGGGNRPMRRINLLRLPPRAELISSELPNLQHKLVDGREQLFLDTTLDENQNLLISFRYRLTGR
ncbi:MAG TPA: sigma-70 family RNA polymerase sigma factor [Tepidisphaeraceae bacterium]|nr:sigma-70 family RNA polymerase sigma factor [Tepidisphaeraceae bacterium]